MFEKKLKIFFIILLILVLFIALFSGKTLSISGEKEYLENSSFHYSSDAIFSWPVFGYYTISSSFGYRISPTTGASSYHSGIDIPATERN